MSINNNNNEGGRKAREKANPASEEGILSFLAGMSDLASTPREMFPPVLLDGMGIRDAHPLRGEGVIPTPTVVDPLGNSLLRPLSVTARDPQVKKALGASRQPTVPSILCRRALVTAWSKSIPWKLASRNDLNTDGYGFSHAIPFGIDYDTTADAAFEAFPLSADLAAYQKVVAAVRSGTYTQTPRLDNTPGIGPPFQSFSLYPLPAKFISLADLLVLDPMGLAQLASRLSPQMGGNNDDIQTQVAWNGQMDPHAPFAMRPPLFPAGSAYATRTFHFSDAEPGSAHALPVLEFLRQLVTSPLLKLVALPRPPVRSQAGYGIAASGLTPSLIPSDLLAAMTPASASGLVGLGGVSVKVDLFIRDHNTEIEIVYPAIDFYIAFDILDGSSLPSFVIPRGAVVSNVFHPGFTLDSNVASPIIMDPTHDYSYVFTISVLTWGSATGCSWGLGLSNPSSSFFTSISD